MKYTLRKNKNKLKFMLPKKSALIWFMWMILISLHVYFAVQTSSMGAKIALYEQEAVRIENENKDLSSKLIDTMSLTKLSEKSEEMGFSKIDTTYYLSPSDNFAQAR